MKPKRPIPPNRTLDLSNFANSVKVDGLIVLKVPNVLSLKGLATKLLPYSLHVLAYRYLTSKRKGTGGSGAKPFKTYLRLSMQPNAIKRIRVPKRIACHIFRYVSSDWLLSKRTAHAVYGLLKAIFRFISFGRINDSEFIIFLKKVPDR